MRHTPTLAMAHDSLVAAGLITINAAAQLPLKLTSKNYTSWRAQFLPLMVGCNLVGYIDGTNKCPPKEILEGTVNVPNPKYQLWVRQDQLILHAIIASVTESVISLISLAKTSEEAWTKLSAAYANRSRSRLMSLKEQLSRLTKGTQSVTDYMSKIKSISDELTIIGSPLDDLDLVIHTLNGLGQDYKEISAAVRARESSISFEDLFDKLQEHERLLQRDDGSSDSAVVTANYAQQSQNRRNGNNYRGNKNQASNNNFSRPQNQQLQHAEQRNQFSSRSNYRDNRAPRVICQLCDRPGHSAKTCRSATTRQPVANSAITAHAATSSSTPSDSWLVDSGASHHITSDL